MNRPFCDTRVPAVGSIRRMFSSLAGTLAALIIVQSALAAFPVDPVRIFARDQRPAAGRLEVEASVWQGGAPTRPGDTAWAGRPDRSAWHRLSMRRHHSTDASPCIAA